MPKAVDLSGQVFGKLTAVTETTKRKNSFVVWLCECACGNSVEVTSNNLRKGKTKSCGCLIGDVLIARNTTHGMSGTPEHLAWTCMNARCYNPNTIWYKRYGGRGISVCDRWRTSFENFFNDVGRKPTVKHSLDRIDNNGNYEPSNCRWATATEQALNRDVGTRITVDGVMDTMSGWSLRLGGSRCLIRRRIQAGMRPEDAVKTPIAINKRRY
jgi:hypothetical protein